MNIINILNNKLIEQYKKKTKIKIPNIKKGDKISVRYILSKKQKRKQIFTGICTTIKNKGYRSSFTLENIIYKQKISKTFILYSSMLISINKK
jgi:ribosomal protein L19